MKPQASNKKREIISALAVLLIVVVIVGSVAVTNKKTTTTDTKAATTASTVSSTATSTTYKDGTYMADGEYDSPGGQEAVAVSLTLKSGIITDATVTSKANDVEAGQYQQMFISSYKSKVVGKNIVSIKLSRVSGSSLTSQGFNSALQQIESKAKSA